MQSPQSPVVRAAIAAALVLAGTGWLGRSPAGAAAAALPTTTDDPSTSHRIASDRPGDTVVKALGSSAR